MLTSLYLRNFKSWKDTGTITLKPITGLFGTNSSGKSSLIQALLLLKQTVESTDRGAVFHFGDRRTHVDLGDFKGVINGHDTNKEVKISLSWTETRPFTVRDTKPFTVSRGRRRPIVARSPDMRFEIAAGMEAAPSGSRLVVDHMEYHVGSAGFGMRRTSRGDYQPFAEDVDFNFVRNAGRPWKIDALINCYDFPDTLRANYQNAGFLTDLAFALELRLDDVYYLGPLRAPPQRTYTWSGAQPIDMGPTGESVVEAIIAARERKHTISRGRGRRRLSLQQYVAQWLKELGLIHDFRIGPVAEGSRLYEVKVRKSAMSPEVLITDVGFGVSQILPALVLCFYVPQNSTVILEQPEIHLHPLAQAGLADVLVDAWKKRKVQIIVESHSEHLLRRLQRRITEEKVSQDDVGVFFCSPGDGASSIDALDIDEYGNIANWPKDFFGDQFGEIASMSEAALARRMNQG